jgi:uncharacterized protein with von Willebrand factor type A (vWA) domain
VIVLIGFARVSDAAPKRHDPGTLVLLIDRSGSMQGPRLDAAKEAALAAVDIMDPSDQIAIIAFDSEASIQSRLKRARDRKLIANDLSHLNAGGGTNFLPALQLAFELLRDLKPGNKQVILISDGDSPSDGISALLNDMRQAYISVSVVAMPGGDRDLLTMIADAGEGRLFLVDEVKAVPKTVAQAAKAGLAGAGSP